MVTSLFFQYVFRQHDEDEKPGVVFKTEKSLLFRDLDDRPNLFSVMWTGFKWRHVSTVAETQFRISDSTGNPFYIMRLFVNTWYLVNVSGIHLEINIRRRILQHPSLWFWWMQYLWFLLPSCWDHVNYSEQETLIKILKNQYQDSLYKMKKAFSGKNYLKIASFQQPVCCLRRTKMKW